MQTVLILLLFMLPRTAPLSFNFGNPSCAGCEDWYVVLDGVMGGLSTGELERKEKSIRFTGTISLENNGGFASIRTPFQKYDLSNYTTVTVRYRSTGQDFALTLNKYRRFWKPQYKTNLPVTGGEWKELTCKLSDLNTFRLDNQLDGSPTQEDLAKIIRLGFISNDKKATPFMLEIDYLLFE